MMDEPSRSEYGDGRRHEPPFLSRALSALLRLVDIYAAERGINGDPAHHFGRVTCRDPSLRIDAPAAPPQSSPTDTDPPGTGAGSRRQGSSAEDKTAGPLDAPKKSRGGWTKGNSTSAQIRAGAVEYLRQKGARAKGSEIWEALKAKGMIISTKDPSALVSSRIGRSPLFDHTYLGYGLREWDGGDGPRSGAGK
jgi:hypothetical protein